MDRRDAERILTRQLGPEDATRHNFHHAPKVEVRPETRHNMPGEILTRQDATRLDMGYDVETREC